MIKRVLQSVSVTGQSLLSVGPSENWPESCTSEWVYIFIGKTNGGRKKGNWKGVTCRDHIKVNIITFRSPIKQPSFGDATTRFPAKWRLSNKHRNSILMTRHYPDLGGASGWSCRVGNLLQPIRNTTQMCDNISNTLLFLFYNGSVYVHVCDRANIKHRFDRFLRSGLKFIFCLSKL